MILTDIRVRHDDHDVGVGGKDVDQGCKVFILDFHALELGLRFADRREEKMKSISMGLTEHVIKYQFGSAEKAKEGQRQTKCRAPPRQGDGEGTWFSVKYLQLNLNCLIILLIFS